jgi:type II secretory pathway component PulM
VTKPLAIKALVWTGVLLALAGVWSLYTQPDFLVKLADQLWSCF